MARVSLPKLRKLGQAMLGAGLLVASTAALADPISLIASAIVSGFQLTGLQAFAVFLGANLLSSTLQKKKARKAQKRAIAEYNASLQDRTVQFSSTESFERIVYGSPAPFAGNIQDNLLSGASDQFRHILIDLCQHECDGVETIYCDGIDIGPLDANGWVTQGEFYESRPPENQAPVQFLGLTVSLPAPASEPQIYIEEIEDGRTLTRSISFTQSGLTLTVDAAYAVHVKYLVYKLPAGTPRLRVSMHLSPGGVDVADAFMIAELPSKVTAAHRLSGHTYAWVTCDLRFDRFKGGQPGMTFRLRGKKVYDPRTTLTAYSANPALCLMDYLRTRHGGANPLAAFDATWIAAANACDTAAYPAPPPTPEAAYEAWRNGSGGHAELFRVDALVSLDAGREQIISLFESSCSGDVSESAGLMRLRVGVWEPPVLTLTDDDVFGFVEQVQGGLGVADCFNGATGNYVSRIGLGSPRDAVPYSNGAFLAADGGEPRLAQVDMQGIGAEWRAQHAMRIAVERSRAGRVLKIPCGPRAWPLQPGDRVSLTYSPYGIVSETFRVTGWETNLAGLVNIEVTQDYQAIWDLADEVNPFPEPVSGLSNGLSAPALVMLPPQSGTSQLIIGSDGSLLTGVLLSWQPVVDTYVLYGGYVEIEYRSITQTNWQALPNEAPERTSTRVLGLSDGLHYQFRARFVNERGVKGFWGEQTHQVLGKNEAPSAPTDLTISATSSPATVSVTMPADLDFAGIEIRAAAGSSGPGVFWSRATPLHTGRLRSFPWAIPVQLYGVQTIFAKAFDTSGNESEPVSVVVSFNSVSENNIFQTFDYDAALYPGDKTNCAVSAGDLLADLEPGSSLDLLVDQDTEPDLDAGLYLAMTYITSPFVPFYGGGTLVLTAGFTGSAPTIEYRIDGDTGASIDAESDLDAMSNVDGASLAWQIWPGALAARRGQGVQWRIAIGGGSQQGSISVLTAGLALKYATQNFTDIEVGLSALRCDPAVGTPPLRFADLRDVQITPAVDGSGATGGRYARPLEAALGGLVELTNSSGSVVAGRANILQGGLIDETA